MVVKATAAVKALVMVEGLMVAVGALVMGEGVMVAVAVVVMVGEAMAAATEWEAAAEGPLALAAMAAATVAGCKP